MEGLSFLILIVIATFIVAGGLASLRILMGLGKKFLTVAGNMVAGLILLLAVNILPFINIPLTPLTVLVAGFGGITGVGILLLGNIIRLI